MGHTYDKDFFSRSTETVKPKRIVVCCDGTWQSATSVDPKHGCPSNVARLSRVLAKAGLDREEKEWQQIVYYDADVGTGDITAVEAARQGSQGLGLLENVLEAYNFIVSNYNKGDHLFFFGFSRGAYTVRAAAGLVQQIGIIQPYLMPAFLERYGKFIRAENFSKPFTQTEYWTDFMAKSQNPLISPAKDIIIQVIGVWDTVGSLGVPDLGHWLKKDNSNWRKAYQFYDTDLSSSDKNPAGDREQLASITYAWMLDRVRPYLALNEDALAAQLAEIEATLRNPAEATTATAWEHAQDWVWGKVEDSYTMMYKFFGSPADRTPRQYHPRETGYTVERVHPTVHFRQQYHRELQSAKKSQKVYEPAAMHGWERVKEEHGYGKDLQERKGWMWIKYKKDTGGKRVLDATGKPVVERSMWEFEIGDMPENKSVERWLINRSWKVQEYYDDVKQGWN
ncbi:putative peptidoglycan binding domain containing protein [Neofusicoccum parvum UCRNP2]|uniref:Putative peptidoglycan binding domain containing protein n=1 Tax=Botryosphaeria parva (strain UCR-NP2) TaxID=1287680 RepID=R1ESX7_BOTPV|nr:putative peptidoglycan binding domain containing protein [Neofusicoccum parvum UCRNP2]